VRGVPSPLLEGTVPFPEDFLRLKWCFGALWTVLFVSAPNQEMLHFSFEVVFGVH